MFVGTIHAFCLELLKSESPKHLKFEVLNEVQQGLFVDQRWIDFVPSYFDHTVVFDQGYNVAYCYDAARVMKWLFKQAQHGFQGVTGSFE